jgi:hypothetical protein
MATFTEAEDGIRTVDSIKFEPSSKIINSRSTSIFSIKCKPAPGPVKVMRLATPKDFDANSIPRFANTFDICFRRQGLSQQTTGTIFLAVRAYWIIFQIESSLGVDPDDWRAQTLNFYLSTVSR